MINILLTSIFFTIVFYSFRCYQKKDYWYLMVCLLCLVTFSPMMQYVVFPEYKKYDALGIRYLAFDRVWVEYIVSLVFVLFYISLPKPRFKGLRFINLLLILYIIFNLSQFFFCVDYIRAINGYWISVINPVLYILCLNKVITYKGIIFTSDIYKFFYRYSVFLLFLFFAISFFNFLRVGFAEDEYVESLHIWGISSGLGVFRSRIVLTSLFFISPIILFPSKYAEKKGFKHLLLFTIGFLLVLFVANSRTMYFGFLVMFIISVLINPFKSRKSQLFFLSCFIIFVVVANSISTNINILELVTGSFLKRGDTVVSSALEDERFLIWNFALKCADQAHYLGTGIGSFTLLYERHYSNAHSLYLSILAERGIFVFLLIIYTLIYIIFVAWNKSHSKGGYLYRLISIGTICYCIISYTGEELFNVAQVAYSLTPYMIFIFAVFVAYNSFVKDE